MKASELTEAWVRQAQYDAERGVIECRVCRQTRGLDETTTLWRNGLLVFALCDRCVQRSDLLMRSTERGLELRALQRGSIIGRG